MNLLLRLLWPVPCSVWSAGFSLRPLVRNLTDMEIITPSNLQQAEQCLRKYNEMYRLKTVKYVENEKQRFGKQVHTAIEACFKEGWEDGFWPAGMEVIRTRMRRHYDALINLPSAGWEVKIEQNEAIDWYGRPINYWHKEKRDIFARCTLDYQALNFQTGRGLFFDWKTGKSKGSAIQFHLNAILTAARTGIQHYQAVYVYVEKGEMDPPLDIFVRPDDINLAAWTRDRYNEDIFAGGETTHDCLSTISSIIRLREAYAHEDFPEKSGPLCGWCDVPNCEGKNRKWGK